uniref:Uncharacterized protein n=1 Tax=viral metagenome TaxID=1070528 RepID=A0A6M3KNM9_9ZZZZ
MDNLLRAWMVYDLNSWVPFDPNIEKFLPNSPSPEDLFLKKEKRSLLSKNAQEMIELINDPPKQFQYQLDQKNSKKITIGKITEFLREIDSTKWKFKVIQSAIGEIKEYLKGE